MLESETTSDTSSCRLKVILARNAPVGVIFRRSPKKRVRLILWNTDDDTFLPGQWFHGYLYEQDSDLTPNGRYLVYYAGKYAGSRTGNYHKVPIVRSWTAISRPPYLTALALWQSTYGGSWESNRDLRLAVPFNGGETHPDFPLSPNICLVDTPRSKSPDAVTVGQSGVLRGWRFDRQHLKADLPAHEQPQVWHKEETAKRYRLIHTSNKAIGSSLKELFLLQHIESRTEIGLPVGTCWADWDLQGRLLWARQGELWAMTLPDEAISSAFFAGALLLADFTAMAWENVPAPDWAKRW